VDDFTEPNIFPPPHSAFPIFHRSSPVANGMSVKESFTLSSLSLGSDDWDRSEGDINPSSITFNRRTLNTTPRNSVVFPRDGVEDTPGRSGSCPGGKGKGKDGRSLSELMRLHAEKGTDVSFSAEEVSQVADLLKQWINSGTSPYEDEDEGDFFSCSQDDTSLRLKRSSRPPMDVNGRPRGQSESMTVRPSNPSDCVSSNS